MTPTHRTPCLRTWSLAVTVATLAAAGFAEPARAATRDAAAAIRDRADSLYAAGRFAEADAGFARVLERRQADTLALVRRARIALYANRLDDALAFLADARRAGAARRPLDRLVSEAHYRRDDYPAAARAALAAGDSARARKLAAFGATPPYRIEGGERTVVPFVQTDPLPFVELEVNGRGPFLFLIDTGAGETVIDPVFADSAGAARYGEETATFAGDRRAAFAHGRIETLALGGLTLRGVPIHVLDTRKFAAAAMGRRVAGILGTLVLARFRATLDYPGHRLVLEPRGVAAPPPAGLTVAVPFWMAGDHLVLAHGTLDSTASSLWLVDTGLAGAAFTAPASTLAEAGIATDSSAAFSGVGGGGTVRVTPFRARRLALGAAEARDLLGIQGAFPESLERSQGFRIGGLISHAFFRSRRLTLDFDAMRLLLDQP